MSEEVDPGRRSGVLRNLTCAMRKLIMHDEAVRSLQIVQLDARILEII